MWPLIRKFFTDETVFERATRSAAIGLGLGISGGYIAVPDDWKLIGVPIAMFGGFIGAGEKNPPQVKP